MGLWDKKDENDVTSNKGWKKFQEDNAKNRRKTEAAIKEINPNKKKSGMWPGPKISETEAKKK